MGKYRIQGEVLKSLDEETLSEIQNVTKMVWKEKRFRKIVKSH